MNNIKPKKFFLYQQNWRNVKPAELALIEDLVNNDFYSLNIEKPLSIDNVAQRRIPFYPKLNLIRIISSEKTPPKGCYFLFHTDEEQLFYLDGTSPVLHKMNEQGFLSLTEDTLFDYLNFFCLFVQGAEGPFLVAESTTNPFLANIEKKSKAVLKKHLFHLQYRGRDDNGSFLMDAAILYGHHLFHAQFVIRESGMIEMSGDESLAELPDDCGYEPFKIPRLSNQRLYNSDFVKFVEMTDLIEREKNSEDHGKKIYQSYIQRLGPSSGYLPYAKVSDANCVPIFGMLRQNHPHFKEVIEHLEQQMVLLSLLDTGVFKIQPIILDGPPGIGKTRFVQDIAQAFSIHFEIINCGNLSAGFEIGGASLVWKTGKPGRVVETIKNATIINPIIMLDELDKIAISQNQYNVLESLYSLLEPITARCFKDEGLNVATNCEHVNWIATCNEFERLPSAIQSRFRRFQIAQPNHDQMTHVIQSVFSDLVSENRWGKGFQSRLSDETASYIASSKMPPRLMKRVLMEACTRAVLRYKHSNRLHQEKIALQPEDVIFIELPKERSIGFIQ